MFSGIIGKIGINFLVGWEALLRNKFRSLLTLLGIILGIFIVVTTVSISGSIKTFLVSEMNRLGDTKGLSIGKKEWYEKSPGKYERSPKTANLSMETVSEIRKYCPSISMVAAANVFGRLDTSHQGKSMPYELLGVTMDIKELWNFELSSGRWLQKSDLDTNEKVVVIGSKIKDELFGSINPVGKEIRAGTNRLTVIGSIKKRQLGMAKLMPFSIDNDMYAPITTVDKYYTGKYMRNAWINARAKELSLVEQAQNEIKMLFFRKFGTIKFHGFGANKDAIKEIDKMVLTIQLVAGCAAAISLIVGGIGTMNIMLVSVTERTKEIGLRKALGATSNDIRFQFLVEAIVVCLFGGLVGTFLSIFITSGAGWAITVFFLDKHGSVWESEVKVWAAIGAFIISTLVGTSAGLYPSNKAAKLTPVQALRFD